MNIESKVKLFGHGSALGIYGMIDGRLRAVKTNYPPYAFVEKKYALSHSREFYDLERCDLKAVDGTDVMKFLEPSPLDVARRRDYLRKRGVETYEADIRYVRRLLVDGVFGINYDDRAIFLDVELDDSKGILDYGSMSFLSVAMANGNDEIYMSVKDYDSEAEFLEDVVSKLMDLKKTIIVGWNVEFDYNHLIERGKKLKTDNWEYLANICYPYDLRNLYKNHVKGLSSYSLEEVSNFEGFDVRKHREKHVSEMSSDELREYNLNDVRILREIEEKYHFLEVEFALAKEVNLALDMLTAGVIGDSLILRRLRELGYVAPNAVKRKRRRYKGAMVMEPYVGVYEKVLCLDVSSLYPNIILELNVDIDGFDGEVVPYLIRDFLAKKEYYGKRGDKVRRAVYKRLANATYGLFAFTKFRFFNEKKSEMITKRGREVLMMLKNLVEDLGFKVLYGDTDSVFILLSDVENPDGLVEYLNKKIKPYRVKTEYVFDKILFFGSERGGVKKRYVGLCDGKLISRGIELRRSDWCQLAKEVLRDVIDMVFAGKSEDEIREYLAKVRRDMYLGKYDEKLKITKSVRERYKVRTPQGVAYEKAVRMKLIPPDSREITYVFSLGDVEPWRDGVKIDYKRYWNRQIMPPVKRVLESVFYNKSINTELDNFGLTGGDKNE